MFCLLPIVNGQTKRPRGGFKKARVGKGKEHKMHMAKASSPEPDENLCLLRASTGKKKLSTVVSAKEVTRFQLVREYWWSVLVGNGVSLYFRRLMLIC